MELNGRTYAVEAKGTETQAPHGKIVMGWDQVEALASSSKMGKIPILFIVTDEYEDRHDFSIFIMGDTWIEGELYREGNF